MRRRMLSTLGVTFLLLLAACGSDATGPRTPVMSVAGLWAGYVAVEDGYILLTMNVHDDAGNVYGEASLSGGGVVQRFAVNGARDDQALSVFLSAIHFDPIQYVGRLAGDSLTGHFEGNGYDADVTLHHQ